MIQVDGNNSVNSSLLDSTINEIESDPSPVSFSPNKGVKNPITGSDYNVSSNIKPKNLPLISLLNVRSIYCKVDNYLKLLSQFGIEIR